MDGWGGLKQSCRGGEVEEEEEKGLVDCEEASGCVSSHLQVRVGENGRQIRSGALKAPSPPTMKA